MCETVLPAMERHGPIEAWIIDDTGYPEEGQAFGRRGAAVLRPVGQAGQLPGRGLAVDCQSSRQLAGALSALSAAGMGGRRRPQRQGGMCPRRSSSRPSRRSPWIRCVGPARSACHAAWCWSMPAMAITPTCAQLIGALDLTYVAGILSSTTVWPPGMQPLPPKRWSGRGRRPTLGRGAAPSTNLSRPRHLRFDLPKRAWRTVGWREGTGGRLSSRFARVRVRAAIVVAQLRSEEWLLIEWPKGENEPTKYWLSTLPADMTFERLVDQAKLRWRIERDYQELKQELGLGHFEGRGWRGFHHHATLCIAAYGFLISERETIPPSEPRPDAQLPRLELPAGYRPRGAADQARTSRP